MARDVSLDLEASSPAAGLLRPPPAASPIAQERVGPGNPSAGFVGATVVVAVAATAGALLAGHGRPETLAEAVAATQRFGALGLGVGTGRALSAIALGLGVAAVAVAGRSLGHSAFAGLFAAGLLALDPAMLLGGRLALPGSLEFALLTWALAWAVSPLPILHWLAGFTLAGATLLDPAAALWCIPLAALLLLRGHIYAAPQHLALAVAQVVVLPLAAVAIHFLVGGGRGLAPDCLALAPLSRLSLMRLAQPDANLAFVPDPVVWLGGGGALLALGLGAVGFAMARFRVARAPGRLQLRVVSPIPSVLARGAWLLALALLAPPAAWPALFALALALGIRDLGEDAPGFGLVLAFLLLGFSILVLVRAWGAVTGSPDGVEEAARLVPWASLQGCGHA